jgi:hypothetical protein
MVRALSLVGCVMRAFRSSLLLVWLLAGACASGPSFLRRPAAIPPPPSPDLDAGINTHLDAGPRLAQVVDLGAHWIRVDVNWSGLQPSPGAWDTRSLDPILDRACELGLQVYACLISTPPWASSNGQNTGVPDPAAWRAFVRRLAMYSRGLIAVYGIWNEPDLEEEWAGSAQQYVSVLLRPAYQEIKAADPHARVAGPDLALLYSARIGPLKFLKALRKAGAADCLDILSCHIYGGDDFQSKLNGFYAGPVLYRPGLKQMLRRSGWQGKELWMTEVGVNVRDGGDELQAVRLAQEWLTLGSLGWVRKAFVYQLGDDSAEGDQWGLLRSDGSPRPAYLEMRRLFGEGGV